MLKKCINCKKEFETKSNKSKFCSASCSKIYCWKQKNSPYRTQKYLKNLSIKRKEWYETHEHPRGMLGKHQSEKCIKASSERCKKRVGNKHPYWRGGSQVYWNSVACKIMKNTPNICFYKNKKCKGRMLVHHKNKDITNNSKKNLMKVCEYHHRTICHKDLMEKMRKLRWEFKK